MGTLTFDTITMPAGNLGPVSPLPPLEEPHSDRGPRQDMAEADDIQAMDENSLERRYSGLRIGGGKLPYPMLDVFDRDREEREFKVAILENEFLRAVFLLEHGGRLWSLDHKPTGTNLVAPNPIFQPAYLAVRGAWYSGGVEWNATPGGHTPLTMDPHFTAVTQLDDGEPVLRIYEWERICRIGYQVDCWLPDGSEYLFARVRVVNPHDHEIPMYWWTNIAVDEAEGMRVVVPATDAKSWGYGGGQREVPIPEYMGVDTTYATDLPGIGDFYYGIPKGQRPWLAYLDQEGKGLMHASSSRLTGRKLFTWGMCEGGRHWQHFLTDDRPYIELQAGLIQTQYETIPMAGGEDWDWVEAFGMINVDGESAHSKDWALAGKTVGDQLDAVLPQETLEQVLVDTRKMSETPAERIVLRGSGWGALEGKRRERAGQEPGFLPSLAFDDSDLGPEQAPWMTLMDTGAMPDVDPADPPVTFMAQPEWLAMLEEAVAGPSADNWFAWYQLGTMKYKDDPEAARAAWDKSLELAPNAWAMRNLAFYWYHLKDLPKAADCWMKAHDLAPEQLQLAKECIKGMVWTGRFQEILDWWPTLSEEIRNEMRMRIIRGVALLGTGRFEEIEELLATPFEMPDLREAEVIFSNLWNDCHAGMLARDEGVDVNDEIRKRAERQFPVPKHLEFRVVKRLDADVK